MSAENLDNPSEQSVVGSTRKNKKSILYDKTFLIDIVDTTVNSKVEKLITSYGGKILQTLEKNTNYLISDKINTKKINLNSDLETICKRDTESKNVPCCKRMNSNDLINKANLLNIQILSAKQFQHWLKSLLKKIHIKKKPADKVASVLRGKVSLKIESIDQGQCPVFEFIPKWPDLGDALCKNITKIPAQNSYSEDKSVDEYNSSDQYSTSEIGGLCELCDMPFMNYKEHINTKKHMRESQDENKFHELDVLINERPLNVIFNQFTSDNNQFGEDRNSPLETSGSTDCIENTIITIVNSDFDNNKQTDPCSCSDNRPMVLKQQKLTSLNKKCCSDTNISFVPQKRPSKICVPHQTDIKVYKNPKRKRKKIKKTSSKDIYKVEVVNTELSNSKNNTFNIDKPPVIIRLKRVQCSKTKIPTSEAESYTSSSNDEDNNDKNILVNPIPDQRYIRVVRKPSFTYEPKRVSSSKGFSQDHIFSFELPKLRRYIPSNANFSYPTNICLPNIGFNVRCIQEKIDLLNKHNNKCKLSFQECLQILLNVEPQKIGKWFYNIPNKIQDDLSFDSNVLTPFTDL